MEKNNVYFSRMKSAWEIRQIKAKTTYPVRHIVLRKGRPIESCVFEGDALKSSIHLGAYTNETLVGVLSAYHKKHPDFSETKSYQVRGVAVLEAQRKKGIGKLLMEEIERRLSQMEVALLWLNARQTAVPFYQRLSYSVHGDVFDIPHIGPHYCYYKFLL